MEAVVAKKDTAILHLAGHIEDDTDNRRLQNYVAEAFETGITNIVIDCSGIDSISPAVIESLAALPRTVRLLGAKLAIMETKGGIRKLFNIFAQSDFFSYFVIKNDLDAAIRYFDELKEQKQTTQPTAIDPRFAQGIESGQGNSRIVPYFDDEKDDSLALRLQKIEDIENCLVIYMSGWVDLYSSSSFQKRILRAIEAGYIKLIFHCSGVIFWSSVLIGSFTAFLKAIKPRGGDLVLLEIQPKFYEYLQWLGFSQFFNIKENLDEAVSFLGLKSDESLEPIFPRTLKCPICSRKLRASKSGRFRCSECKTILAIDSAGQVFLG